MTSVPRQGQSGHPPDERGCIGILVALGLEAGALRDRLADVRRSRRMGLRVDQGWLSGRQLVVLHGGVGREAARRGAEVLLAEYRPDWLISAGVAGGLREGLVRGDLVLADAVVGGGIEIPLPGLRDASRAALVAAGSTMHRGKLLTMDRPIGCPAEKRALGAEHDALAVDMETLAVAQVCAREQVPLLSLRAISDAVDEALPAEILALFDPESGAMRVRTALAAVLARPRCVLDLYRLGQKVRAASEHLAGGLECLIGELDRQESAEGFGASTAP
ncbi:hypothetical protein ABC977_13610 [Thioalkalicoccus limnaeus]|uniref:Nucleoside phosphorylase domain-containing protein n=1 Tax=Thioalkalicoccus limnaeus TaxID=120681 RepID=A0ABV4BGV1_9GAMM